MFDSAPLFVLIVSTFACVQIPRPNPGDPTAGQPEFPVLLFRASR
jgi:hypothetical protein